ncbi:MAG: PepSY domain-containing protein, partial [Lysobacterales bacterium]
MTRTLKKIHKWVGLLIGVQVFLWLLSGLVIALIDPVKVSGKQWARPTTAESQTIDSTRLLNPAQLPAERLENALGVDLMMRLGKAVYLVKRADGESLISAVDASLIVIDKTDAERLAQQDFGGDGVIVSIEPGMAPDKETRGKKGAFWRVNFSDKANTAIYISASTGAILERRNTYWRVRDFFWMLHIMDYPGRENFNNPLIITVALIAIWLGLSGFGLLFGSFTRADFFFLNIFRKND